MSKDKLKTWAEIAQISSAFRAKRKKIVFTNGCFDILHAGHVQYLEQAKTMGDVLILGLNSDASVSRLKGSQRPIVTQAERALVVAALQCVDYVVVFEQDTPYDLIKLINPHFLVKGGDWNPESIVGSDLVLANGGQVLSLPYLEGHSSSSLVKKLGQNKCTPQTPKHEN